MKTNPADKVQQWAIERLTPYARNARTHSDAQVAQLAASIREWGWTTPILVSPDGGVIAGHGRLLAARQLGMVNVPVIIAEGWSEAKTRAYVLADNQLALQAGWDSELLALELGELGELGFDLDLTGFAADEIAALTPGGTEGLTDPDEVPEVPAEPTTQPGDLWLLGEHRVLCGDSTKAEDVARLMAGAKAEMVFTDPPYGVNIQGKKNGAATMIAGDLTQTAIPFSFDLAVTAATTGDARLYFCGGEGNLYLYQKLFEKHCRQLPRHLIWIKNGFTMKPNGYHNQYEIIFHGYKPTGGGLNKWFVGRTEHEASDVWRISRDPSSTYEHPTQKPIELFEYLVMTYSNPGDVILDLTMGSGTTGVACMMAGRSFIGIEKNKEYFEIAQKRISQAANQPILLAVEPGYKPSEDNQGALI